MQSSPKNYQKQAEVELAYTLLRSSIESLQDILIFSIDKDYRYLNFNQAFKDATAHAYGMVVAKGVSMLETITNENDRAKAKANCDRAMNGESHTTLEVYGVLNKSYFETKYSPVMNDAKEIIGVTILSTNITERKVAEEQIIILNKELETFSYSVAHDLQAPLRIINGYSEILIEDYQENLSEDGKKLLKIISGNVKRMSQLIEGLLHFSKLGRLPLNKVVIDTRNLLQIVLDELITDADTDKVDVRLATLEDLTCDRNLIYHVFSNLISNAIKYSHKTGKSKVQINSWKEDGSITYSVKDNGVGFDMKYKDKIFEVFQRLHKDSEFEGTGIGLAIVQRIISKHNGRIWAESEINKGATFYFSLPT